MRILFLMMIAFLTVSPALANGGDLPVVQKLKRDTSDRRMAEQLASRIRAGLTADIATETFAIEENCSGDDCTVSLYLKN